MKYYVSLLVNFLPVPFCSQVLHYPNVHRDSPKHRCFFLSSVGADYFFHCLMEITLYTSDALWHFPVAFFNRSYFWNATV